MIAEAVAKLRDQLRIPVDPLVRGPVPLNRFFEEMNQPRLSHFTFAEMTRASVAQHLRSQGVPIDEIGDPEEKLAGFLFLAGPSAWAYVTSGADNPIGRQRFTAAHELGHAVLHRDRMWKYRADVKVDAVDEPADPIEREANRFAVELLMPVEVINARERELRRDFGCCPRLVLAYRLASELLVSREALRYRLKNLGVGDE